MDDLISRKALIETYCEENCGSRKCVDAMDRCVFISHILEQPSVEADPVVHGEWEENIMNYICSQCKTPFDDDMTWITGEYKMPNFCPECGADMRKKVQE